jgi:hypothetical protein
MEMTNGDEWTWIPYHPAPTDAIRHDLIGL